MRSFEYAKPATLAEAARLLSESPRSVALAGGTDLLAALKDDLLPASRVVDLKGIVELAGRARGKDGELVIGALTTLQDLLDDAKACADFPALAQAAHGVSSPQVRSRGTIGGDLLQWPRCWYFRKGYGLTAMQGGKSMVADGDNRYHAILGNSGAAKFVSASTLGPALIALGASATIVSASGERELLIAKLFRTPASDAEGPHVLAAGEILSKITVPRTFSRSATYEVRQKEALDWPLAAASVALEWDGAKVTKANVVLGHVAPVPWFTHAAEEALLGTSADEKAATNAAEAAVALAAPLSGNAYKVQLAKVAVKRAVLQAMGA